MATAQSPAITAAELQLVEAFLERRDSFPEDVRRAMAHQIAERLRRGSSISTGTPQDPEEFLEALAERSRNVAHFR
jgi:hypothetical protein